MLVLQLYGGRTIEVEYSLRVGRAPEWADLVLDREDTSRHHLEIRAKGTGYKVWDMESRNGTAVNGRPVGTSGRLLAEGDEIQVGTTAVLRVVSITAPAEASGPTAVGPGAEQLVVELHGDGFIVEYRAGGRRVRDTMPFQLGLTLSLLAQYTREGFGGVPDVDLRAIVWRGDREGQRRGDINRLLLRLRQWFRDRDIDPPPIGRPKGSGATRLEMAVKALTVQPEGWLDRYLDE